MGKVSFSWLGAYKFSLDGDKTCLQSSNTNLETQSAVRIHRKKKTFHIKLKDRWTI